MRKLNGSILSLATQEPKRIWTILVVEDEFFLRDMVAIYLRECGWNVLEAASGEDALLHLDETPDIDVIFTDLRLAGTMNGWDVAEAFRQKLPELPVIYATADAVGPQRRVAESLFFDKPYAPEQIRTACEHLMNGRPESSSDTTRH
jgi:CheY-like chemotaxis protein